MKRILLVSLAILVTAAGTAPAQSPLSYGLKVGVSASGLDVDPEFVDLGSRTSFAGGGFLVVDLPGIWGILVEGLYVPKGASTEVQITDESGVSQGTGTFDYRIEYLEIPVLARISLGAAPVHVLAGPALDLKLSAKGTLEGFPDEDLDWIKGADLGLVAGLGAALPTGFGAVVFDARYTWGTSNLNDGEGATFKNRAFLFTAGVQF